jgi:hypothetical protein
MVGKENSKNRRMRNKIVMKCDQCGVEYSRFELYFKKLKENKYYDKDYCGKCWIKRIGSSQEHRENVKKALNLPECKEKRKIIMKKIYSDPKRREKSSKILKEKYKNLELRKRISDTVKENFKKHPERIEQYSNRMKNLYKNHPELKVQMSITNKEIYKNPEMRQKISDAVINAHKEDPNIRKRISQSLKKSGANVGDKNGMKQLEARLKVSKARKEIMKDPKERKACADRTRKAWEDGKFDGVRVGQCKWFAYQHSNGNIYKVQGTWELAFIKWIDENKLEFLCHRKWIPYILNGFKKNWYPDFWIKDWDSYVDVKCVYFYSQEKFDAIRQSNPDIKIKVLFKEDLEKLGIKFNRTGASYEKN